MYKSFNFKNLLNFEVLLFPKIATVCYLIMVGISVLSGFISFIQGIGADWGGEVMVLSGLAMMTIIPFFIRLWFECLLVFFMINDKLDDVRGERTKSTSETTDKPRASNCKGCGAALEPNARFCGSCGLAMGGPTS